jgi:hypothetical protein
MSGKLKRTFTNEFIEKLKPMKGYRLEFGDTNCRGLVVRVNERGSKTFSIIYRIIGEGGVSESGKALKGTQKRITLGIYPEITVDDARKQTLEIISKALKGEDPRNGIRHYNILKNSTRFDKAAEEFIEKHAKPNTVAWKNSERAFKLYANPFLGSKPIVIAFPKFNSVTII